MGDRCARDEVRSIRPATARSFTRHIGESPRRAIQQSLSAYQAVCSRSRARCCDSTLSKSLRRSQPDRLLRPRVLSIKINWRPKISSRHIDGFDALPSGQDIQLHQVDGAILVQTEYIFRKAHACRCLRVLALHSSSANFEKRRCCASAVAPGGRAVCALSVRCIRSCRGLSCGCPTRDRHTSIP